MRKNVFLLASVAVAATAIIACQKEANIIQESSEFQNTQGVTIQVIANQEDTKTAAIDGDIPTIQWTTGDRVIVFETVDGTLNDLAYSENAVIAAGKASFKATLSSADPSGDSYQYTAVYPAGAVVDLNTNALLYMPEVQNLVNGNFAPNSDILFSSVLDHGDSRVGNDEGVQFAFRRLGTVVRLNLVGITPGEKIQEITLTAPAAIAGTIEYNPVTGYVDPETAFGEYASNTITLNTDNLVATGNDVVWFRVIAERDWGEAGDKIGISVETDKASYYRDGSDGDHALISSPVIQFPDGGVTKFGINLAAYRLESIYDAYLGNWQNGAQVISISEKTEGRTYFVSGLNDQGSYTVEAAYRKGRLVLYDQIVESSGSYDTVLQGIDANLYYPGYPSSQVTLFTALYDELEDELIISPGTTATDLPIVYYIWITYNDRTPSGNSSWTPIPSSLQRYIPPTASYGDYLREWTDGARVYTIEQKVAGESYYLSGLANQGEYTVEALFEDGYLVLYDQVVATDGSVETILQGMDGAYYPGYPTRSNVIFKAQYNDEEDVLDILNGTTQRNSTSTYYMWLYYDNGMRTGYIGFSGIPTVLEPYVPVVDPNTYIYQEGFEDGITGWTLLDADGDSNNWFWRNTKAHYGDYCLSSASWNTSAFTPDNYAFTPAIELTANNYISFWVSASTPGSGYDMEHYGVYITEVAPTLDNVSSAVELLAQTYPNGTPVEQTSAGYQHFVLPVPSAFEGKTVYIGIRHFDCTDQEQLVIDDIAVIEGTPVFSAPAAAPKPSVAKASAKAARKAVRIGGEELRFKEAAELTPIRRSR